MDLGFSGEVARLYETYRRGYPAPVVDAIVDAFALSADDVAVDLGCGTGQLTLPLADRLRAVVGVDPEPDMLTLARRAAARRDVRNVAWMLGDDADVPAVGVLLGAGSVGVVTVATALHWMDTGRLFPAVADLVRPGGGFAVVTNGRPLWLLDAPWSRELRAFLESWTGSDLSWGCGSDDADQRRYREGLTAAGLTVSATSVAYPADLDLPGLVGEVLTAFPASELPTGPDRERFAEGVGAAVGAGPFHQPVQVDLLFGRRRGDAAC
ncbi:class I SAM-dependent methyltransferase [Polymorphospora sp. NPDC050346]|uniref:class I SAM-dependent methyltransferase n=1 Tax=Polymorphospora sp. NPDC050346 TaxID=3155780 RepID=UPI00340BD982